MTSNALYGIRQLDRQALTLMRTAASANPLAVAEDGDETKKHPVDGVFEELDAALPNLLEGIEQHPEDADTLLDASAKMKALLMKTIVDQKEIPGSAKGVEAVALPIVAQAAEVGAVDAALLLVLHKIPKAPEWDVAEAGGANGKTLKDELTELFRDAVDGFRKEMQTAGKETLQEASAQMKQMTKLIFNTAKLLPLGGEDVPLEVFQGALAGMTIGAFSVGLLDTGVAFLDRMSAKNPGGSQAA